MPTEIMPSPSLDILEVAKRVTDQALEDRQVDANVLLEDATSKISKPTAQLGLHACNESPLGLVRFPGAGDEGG